MWKHHRQCTNQPYYPTDKHDPPIEAMSNIYDINGDGKLEFLGTDFRFHSYQYPGLMPMEQYSIPESREHARLCNLNNDAFPDIRYLEGGTIAISAQEGIWQTIDNVSEAPYPCDYNNDGRIDLMHDNRKIYAKLPTQFQPHRNHTCLIRRRHIGI